MRSTKVKGEAPGLEVTRSGRDIVVDNGAVRLCLVYRDGGYAQEFYGSDRSGQPRLVLSTIHRDLIPFTEHRTYSDPFFCGHRQHLFELSRESVRMGFSEVAVSEGTDSTSIRLSGGNPECEFVSTITMIPGSKFVHVSAEARLLPSRRPHVMEYLMSVYAFLPDGLLLDHYVRPDYAWVPSLRPEDDHVIAERSFSSGAVMVQHRTLAAALVADRDRPAGMPLALDLDQRNGLISAPLLACGLCDSEPDGHFSRHDMGMVFRPAPGVISYSFWVYIDAVSRSGSAAAAVQDFLWQRSKKRTDHGLRFEQRDLPDALPTAYALKTDPRGLQDIERANRIVESVLGAQTKDGLFDLGDTGSPGAFDTVQSAEIGRWLLAIHRDCGADERILRACKLLGDFFTSVQSSSGAIPAWLDSAMAPVPDLRDSIQCAAAGRFLAGLYAACGKRSYLSAAQKTMKFVANQVARTRYVDRETFLAGSHAVKDGHTGVAPQGAAAMRHAADLAIAMFEVTGDDKHLKAGLAALQELSWLQDTWNEHPGGFFPGNSFDGRASHAAFGRTFLEYYQATKKVEHIERGIAAIHAGLALGDAEAAGVQCWAVKTLGSAVIDLKTRRVHVIGSCRIGGLAVKPGEISFEMKNGGKPDMNIRFSGLRGRTYRIAVNGKVKPYSRVELESGITIPVAED